MLNLDNEKNIVLVANTAQAVFKHLDRIRDNRTLLGTRWIWELLQNARDVATENGVRVSIEASAERLRFRHDGRPFAPREVAHLIFHGSTKVDLDGPVGRYGSGFLSTHLLSPVVRARGRLDDNRCFECLVDRSGANVDKLSEGMETSWQSFVASVESGEVTLENFTTEFEYPLGDGAADLVAAGLVQLKVCGALVLAFCPELVEIRVQTPQAMWSMTRSNVITLTDTVSLLTINYQEADQASSRIVAVSKNDGPTIVALPLEQTSQGICVSLHASVPRLYVLFPMVTTERLALPAAVSSMHFKPREDRDGISLQGDADGPKENRRLLEQSRPQIAELLACAAKEGWHGTEQLISFDTFELPDWVGEDWYVTFLRVLVEVARTSALLGLREGGRIAPKNALIAFGDSDDQCVEIGALAGNVLEVRSKIPSQDFLLVWYHNLKNWGRLLGVAPGSLPEALTLDRLAQGVANAATVEKLQATLSDATQALAWLVNLIQLIHQSGRTKLFDDLALLPSQSGKLRKRSELLSDMGIDAELKDIGARLGVDLRARLLNSNAALPELAAMLGKMNEEDALGEVIQHFKTRCSKAGRIPLPEIAPSVDLFCWISAREEYLSNLWGFPVATEDKNEQSALALELVHNAKVDEMLLAPSSRWPDALKPFALLFPKRKMLSAAFGDSVGLSERWPALATAGVVHLSPIYVHQRKMDSFLPDEPLASEDAKAHEATQAVEVSDIAYLRGDDIGLLDTIRNSPARAMNFVKLMLTLSDNASLDPFEMIPVECGCGQSHRIYRAAWLVPVRSRSWIPLGLDGKRSNKVTAESLAGLLENSPELAKQLSEDRGSELLKALAISPADFALRAIAKDEESRVSLIRSMGDLAQAAGGSPGKVRELVDEIREHPEIIDEISRRKIQREEIHRNQQIGKLVEDLLRAALEGENLVVQRTGVGSDFEVDSDVIEEGQEILLELTGGGHSTLIEVKSTRTDDAKMTPRQAEMACATGNRFALCVVALNETEPTMELVRDESRFVFGIGDRLRSVWTQYESIQDATSAARSQVGPIAIDMVEGRYRFRVGREVWSSGLTFDQAVVRFARTDADS